MQRILKYFDEHENSINDLTKFLILQINIFIFINLYKQSMQIQFNLNN